MAFPKKIKRPLIPLFGMIRSQWDNMPALEAIEHFGSAAIKEFYRMSNSTPALLRETAVELDKIAQEIAARSHGMFPGRKMYADWFRKLLAIFVEKGAEIDGKSAPMYRFFLNLGWDHDTLNDMHEPNTCFGVTFKVLDCEVCMATEMVVEFPAGMELLSSKGDLWFVLYPVNNDGVYRISGPKQENEISSYSVRVMRKRYLDDIGSL